MKYRVEYRTTGWQREVDEIAERQAVMHALDDGRRLHVHLARVPGTRGPGRIAFAAVMALIPDQWGRRRWKAVEFLGPDELDLVET